MMQGKSNKLICRALDLAEPTVKNHVSAILKALQVSNRTEAVLAVAAFGGSCPSRSNELAAQPRLGEQQQPRRQRRAAAADLPAVQQVMAGSFRFE